MYPYVFITIVCVCYTGDGKGDACDIDYDGDGIDDNNDVCPYNNLISTTSFSDAIKIKLDEEEQVPYWDYIGVSIYTSLVNLHRA